MSGNDIWTITNDDRRRVRIDLPYANIRYIGRADSTNTPTSEPRWMIRREYKNGTETEVEFANFSSYSAVWDDRESYFSAAVGLTAGAVANAVWNEVIESGYSSSDILKVLAAFAAGKTSITALGAGDATVVFRDLGDTKDRIEANMEGSERASVILDTV